MANYNVRSSLKGGYSSRWISEDSLSEALDRALKLYFIVWGEYPDTIQVTSKK